MMGWQREVSKKAIGLHVDWQNNNFACVTLFCIFFAVTARLPRDAA